MAQENNNPTQTKVITGLVRFSYCHVFEAASAGENSEPKYSVSLIIPKSDTATLDKIKAAIAAAKELGKANKWKGKIPAKLKTPLRDGDEERPDDEAYANSYFINAASYSKPGVIDRSKNDIKDEAEFYSGCYGRASINFYPYSTGGSNGIAAGLNNLQKIKDGEPLGGRQSAEADFDDDFVDDNDDVDF